MTDDLRALLAAVVADPADDTARLVYADCLEEHGNAPRAEFIRLQIEAERLHPDSHARAVVEEKARVLFAEHWIEWWREVCAAVGLSAPVPKPTGALGRLARRVGIIQPVGHPYQQWQFNISLHSGLTIDQRRAGLGMATFHRGFPDTFDVSLATNFPHVRDALRKWPESGPLTNLSAAGPWLDAWLEGPHLAGLRALKLWEYDPATLLRALNSPYLNRLTELTLDVPEYEGDGMRRAFADELAELVTLPRIRQLKRLAIPVWDDDVAAVLAGATNLVSLEALEIEIDPGDEELTLDASRRFTMLARAPGLSGLKELTVVGDISESGIEAALRNPTWTGLRKLVIDSPNAPSALDPFTGPDDLPELEELRLSGISYSTAGIAALVRSPLLKRLRHFAVRGGPRGSVDLDIADAVDPDQIATFAIGETELWPRVAKQLRERFGDRLRLLED